MQKHLKKQTRVELTLYLQTLPIVLWTNLAAGFAGSDLDPNPSSSFFAGMLVRHYDLSENMLAAALLITLCALHFFREKKSSPNNTTADNLQIPKASPLTPITPRPTIAIIDDDIFIRESWELFLQEFNLITFDSPESFLLALERNTSLITSLDAIVVDYDFDTKSTMSGADLASILRKRTSSPIILSTDREQKDIADFDRFDLHLDKNILDWHSLQKLLPAVISQ